MNNTHVDAVLRLVSCFLLMVLIAVSCSEEQAVAKQEGKPNFIFLFADDLTYKAVSALGNTEISTPYIDQLASGGTTFTHSYNMGGWNGAICAASRAMIISGQSIWNVNNFKERWKKNDPEALDMTWPKLLESAGYDTYMSGKWHVDAQADSIFQTVRHVRPGMPRDHWRSNSMSTIEKALKGKDAIDEKMVRGNRPIGYLRPLDKDDKSWEPTDTTKGGFWAGGKHWSEVLKDDAVDYLAMAAEDEDPFFMYLAFNAPHDPRQAPAEFIDMYDEEAISLPKNWQPLNVDREAIGNSVGLRDEALAPMPRTEYATKVHIKEYYAIISHLDQQIGEIMAALEKSGKKDDTYIIFTADHGLAIGSHGFIGKQNMYDHSMRTPFMIMGPDIPKGRKIDSDIYLQDVMPTTLELANIEVPNYVEFKSLLPSIADSNVKDVHDGIYGAYIGFQRMIRKDGYKLIVYPKIDRVLLYDMVNDPDEINDLAEDPKQQDRVLAMMDLLIEKQNRFGDELDLAYLKSKI